MEIMKTTIIKKDKNLIEYKDNKFIVEINDDGSSTINLFWWYRNIKIDNNLLFNDYQLNLVKKEYINKLKKAMDELIIEMDKYFSKDEQEPNGFLISDDD